MRYFNYTILLIFFLYGTGCKTSQLTNSLSNDKNWNISYRVNCYLPSLDSAQTISENGNNFLRFTLNRFDRGNCPSDRKKMGKNFFRERAEFRSDRVLKGKNEISFKIRFVEGFVGLNEHFSQIHSKYNGCGKEALQFSFDYGRLVVISKLGGRYYPSLNNQEIRINDIIGKWQRFKIILDDDSKKFSLLMNDKLILKDGVFDYLSCGVPTFRFGVYRDHSFSAKTSIVDFDEIQIKNIQ